MKQHLYLLNKILDFGVNHDDRTGVGRRSIFGEQLRFDISEGFPLTTTREIPFTSVVKELLWFINGKTNVKDLDVSIWNKWAITEQHISDFYDQFIGEPTDESKQTYIETAKPVMLGEVGSMYGAMWRNAPSSPFYKTEKDVPLDQIPSDKLAKYKTMFEEVPEEARRGTLEMVSSATYKQSVDQLNELVVSLKTNPYSARHIVTAWVPGIVADESVSPQFNALLGRGSLAPCHTLFQCHVTPAKTPDSKPTLSLQLYQRSCDVAVGWSFNVAQYSLLLCMLAHVTDMEAGEFIMTLGDAHLYSNQVDLALQQVHRQPHLLPSIWLNPEVTDLFSFTLDDIKLINYVAHDTIKYEVSV